MRSPLRAPPTKAIPEPPVTAAIEIQALYANFASMAARIERRSRYLRDFAAAVSHELKTPIAGIKGVLELIDDHPAMREEERARFLAKIEDAVSVPEAGAVCERV